MESLGWILCGIRTSDKWDVFSGCGFFGEGESKGVCRGDIPGFETVGK
jgi:hypothetical protein